MNVTALHALCIWFCLATPILALQRAVPAIQAIVPRATYIGGWPLALNGTGGGCPPDKAPVTCDSGSTSLNTECCPSGQVCNAKGLITAYCCPSDGDCKTSVTNFPVCADSSWQMYEFNYGYFCCEPGMVAVIPLSGYGGLCVQSDQAVPKSQLASAASQVGAVATSVQVSLSATTSPILSRSTSSPNFQETGLTGISSGGSASATTARPSETGSQTSSTSTPGSDKSGTPATKSSTSLGAGPIAGIAIGGVAVILMAAILWALLWRRKPQNQPIQYMPAPPQASELPPTVGRKPVSHAMATSMYSAATPGGLSPGGYSQPPQYESEIAGRYDLPTSPQTGSNIYSDDRHSNFAEMEGPGQVERAELRADHTGR